MHLIVTDRRPAGRAVALAALTLLLLAGMLLTGPTPADAAGGTIRGTVTDADSGRALAGVKVQVCCADGSGCEPVVYTDSRGRFSFGGLWPEDYKVSVWPTGDANGNVGLRVPQVRPDANLDLALPAAAQIAGIVVDTAGTPLGGIKIIGTDPALRWSQHTVTAADGTFLLTHMTRGAAHRVKAHDPSGRYGTLELTGITAPATGVRFELVDSAPEVEKVFKDVTVEHRFAEEIKDLSDREVVRGYADGSFKPTRAVTRQAAAVFLHRLAGSPKVTTPAGFDDVPADHPFHDAIAWLVQEGIADGFDDNTFRPNAEVTRQAAASFLYRYADQPEALDLAGFRDVPAGHRFHAEIAWLVEAGITQGFDDNTFRPNAEVTRQAIAVFLYRLLDVVG